jgi:putative phosphoesterase
MIIIGVLSDTHLKTPTKALAALVAPGGVFHGAHFILHAGDIVSLAVLDALAPVETLAVRGNMDQADVAAQCPQKRVVSVGGKRIGLIHGWGYGEGIEERVRAEFDGVDAIVYGHSHKPANHVRDGVLFFNPGSFGGSRTVGLLRAGKEIEGEIIETVPAL